MTWLPDETEATKAAFVELYGEDLWNQIQAITAPKPLASREVFKPRKPVEQDRPALQTEDSGDPEWWQK